MESLRGLHERVRGGEVPYVTQGKMLLVPNLFGSWASQFMQLPRLEKEPKQRPPCCWVGNGNKSPDLGPPGPVLFYPWIFCLSPLNSQSCTLIFSVGSRASTECLFSREL